MNASFGFRRHWQLGPVGAMQSLARHKTAEAVAPLLVPSGTEGNGADGTRCHGVVVFLVRLHALTKLDATMFSVVDAESGDDGTGTESL